MTCVVGYKYNGDVWMGADSAGTNDWFQQTIRADTKVFSSGPMLFGFTTSFRMGQLLRYSLIIPEQLPRQSDFEYLCTSFITSVRHCLSVNGYAKIINNEEQGGNFLLGYKGELYEVQSDYQISQSVLPYSAIGCGEDFALGAIDILYSNKATQKPEVLITRALEAASKYSAGVAEPFVIMKGASVN